MLDGRCLIVAVGVCLAMVHALETHKDGAGDLTEDPVTCDSKNAFPCDEKGIECIDNKYKCDGSPQCSTWKDESVETCGCLPFEFQCNATHCIDQEKRCDFEQDCWDGADEKRCETFECLPTHFKCANHKCIPRYKNCDFEEDCGDGSDEDNCYRRPCHFGYFGCDNGECILASRMCDGKKNCKDGSDELQERCDSGFQCPTGIYILASAKCDSYVDCKITHADEVNCGVCKPENQCPNGKCVADGNICDLVCDCPGCEDEMDCERDNMYCPAESHYMCRSYLSHSRCIAQHRVCDSNRDCLEYNSDEVNCQSRSKCPKFTGYRGSRYRCKDKKCQSVRCNNVRECQGGDDENECGDSSCPSNQFMCSNRRCVALTSRCDAKDDCMDWSDEIGCENHTCPDGHVKCTSGQCIPRYKWCNHYPDCPDESDERNCAYKNCSQNEFQCNNGECIPKDLVCYGGKKGKRDGCSDKSHLINCVDRVCNEDQFKCRNSYCIDDDQICDHEPDCLNSYDEEACQYGCPRISKVCVCEDTTMMCDNKKLEEIPFWENMEHIDVLYWSGNLFSLSNFSFSESEFDAVSFLDLSNNNLTSLPIGLFLTMWRLTTLNISYNSITVFPEGSLAGLHNLRQLYLQGNDIEMLMPGVFSDMKSLSTLDLSNQNISSLELNTFKGLRSLKLLNLSGNYMTYLHNGVFRELNDLISLDISRNSLVLIDTNVFYSLPSLHLLITDEFRFCCQAENVQECYPEGDAFSSCADLMSNTVLRFCIWILGLTSFVGNGMVIVWRARNPRASKVHSFLITNLAVGDLVMGLYLVIIAAVDAHFRGEYSLHDETWRHSPLCHLAGFFAMFSSELSVLTLTIITLDRLSCIIFPLKIRRLGVKGAVGVMAIIWLAVFVLAFIPLSGLESFGNFYGRSAVCLALPLTPDRPAGWEYSVAITLVMNLVSLIIIAISYIWMFLVAKKTRTAVRCRDTKGDNAMARRMTMIVMTDLLCWIPIVLLGLASMAGIHTSNQVYAWIAVFILPINSAINPVLYTISTAPFLGNVTNRARWFRKSFINSFNADTKHSFVDDRTVQTNYSLDRRASPRRGEKILYSAKQRDRNTSPKNSETIWLKNLRVNTPEYSRGSSSDV